MSAARHRLDFSLTALHVAQLRSRAQSANEVTDELAVRPQSLGLDGLEKPYVTTLYSWNDAVKRAVKMPDVALALAPRRNSKSVVCKRHMDSRQGGAPPCSSLIERRGQWLAA